jgi:ribose-phosphate pyrophosphokinase
MKEYWKSGSLKIFSGNSNLPLAMKICSHLGVPLGKAQVSRFSDGEIDAHILENVRGEDCYIVQSTSNPVNENIMELLIMMDALRRASAGRITAVIPYYGYARADRKAVPRVAITAKLVANLITEAGADRVITLDLHAPQIQGFFDIPLDHLYARPVILEYIKNRNFENPIVVSPDVGSIQRSLSFAKRLDLGLVIIDKRRPKPNHAEVFNVIGNVENMTCLVFDDMVDTAGTLTEVARIIKERGAKKIIAFVTHGVLSSNAIEKIEKSPIEEMVITDTIGIDTSKSGKINIISVAGLLAEAIRRNHLRESISELFN